MIETYEDYKKEALRSIKPHTSKEMAIADWTLGLGGETGELVELLMSAESPDRMVVAKELGDILWYGTALASELEFDIKLEELEEPSGCTLVPENLDEVPLLIEVFLTTCRIQENVKHLIFHKEESVKETIKRRLEYLYKLLRDLCSEIGISIGDAAELNAAKLAYRYNLKNGGSYSKGASENRHSNEVSFEDTEEYKTLHKSITGQGQEIQPSDIAVL